MYSEKETNIQSQIREGKGEVSALRPITDTKVAGKYHFDDGKSMNLFSFSANLLILVVCSWVAFCSDRNTIRLTLVVSPILDLQGHRYAVGCCNVNYVNDSGCWNK